MHREQPGIQYLAPRMLRHANWSSQGSNRQTSDLVDDLLCPLNRSHPSKLTSCEVSFYKNGEIYPRASNKVQSAVFCVTSNVFIFTSSPITHESMPNIKLSQSDFCLTVISDSHHLLYPAVTVLPSHIKAYDS